MIGVKIVVLDVYSTNKRAIHVYERVGFKKTGRRPKFFYRNGKYIGDVIMTKEILEKPKTRKTQTSNQTSNAGTPQRS